MPLQVRIFIGYQVNKEIKIHLDQSPHWREEKMLGIANLIETDWKNHHYIGQFTSSLLSFLEIQEKEKQMKNNLQIYCPKLNVEKHFIYLFPQLFIE